MKPRKPIRKCSDRGKLISEIENYIRITLKVERGARCELCGAKEEFLPYPLSLFHIMEKSTYQRIRLSKRNLLLACWVPYYSGQFCHNVWHHNRDSAKGQRIKEKIKELRGEFYETILTTEERTSPKLTMFRLQLIKKAYEQACKEL